MRHNTQLLGLQRSLFLILAGTGPVRDTQSLRLPVFLVRELWIRTPTPLAWPGLPRTTPDGWRALTADNADRAGEGKRRKGCQDVKTSRQRHIFEPFDLCCHGLRTPFLDHVPGSLRGFSSESRWIDCRSIRSQPKPPSGSHHGSFRQPSAQQQPPRAVPIPGHFLAPSGTKTLFLH